MYDKYAEELQAYLVAKFPFADASTLMEVCEYVSNRTIRLVNSVIDERDREWRKGLTHYRKD